jgi:SprB repeat/HYR domain/Secretion system C-terminal sorting domain
MRLLIFSCLSFFLQAAGPAFSAPLTFNETALVANPTNGAATEKSPPGSRALMLTLSVDSIHHVNCRRATGYLRVLATGGMPAYTYNWSNGGTSAVETSLAPGAYQITVTDDTGATATLSVTILEDLTLPTADAGPGFNMTCANSVATLNGSGSTGPDFWYIWTASNGGAFKSGQSTLTPMINHDGTFTLKVTSFSNGCTATASVDVTSTYQPPTATATGGTFTCSQPSVTLGATYQLSNTIFIWNGPNNYVSYSLNPQVAVVGTFVFKVTDTITTCINTANAVVLADTAKPVVMPVGGVINCNQPTRAITGTFLPVGVTFSWAGPFGFTSTLQNPIVSAAGIYRVTVTKPGSGCTTVSSATITADFNPPVAIATASGAITCVSNSVTLMGSGSPMGITYSWTGPNGFTSNLQNPTVSALGAYTLTTRNPANGCTASSIATVVLDNMPPGASATGGVKTCVNQTVTLNASSNTSGVNYFWSGPGNFTSQLKSPVVTLAGTYFVTVSNPANGCVSNAQANVTQNFTPPTLTVTTATITCYNPAPNVVATSQTNGATFSWSGPNGFTAHISNPTVTVSGTYSVTATNPANGCTAASTIFVSENLATPYVYAGEDRVLNCNFTSILANPIGTSTGNNITYLWTTLDGNIVSGANTLYARFDAVGTYKLTVQNTQSGCVAKDSMVVGETPPLVLNVTQLNGVSCNGGNNGSLKANASGGSTTYSYIWSNGSQTATINNLSAGVYSVTVTDTEGCSKTSSGTVTQPGPLVANVSATGQTQVGLNNGTATVTPTGGTAPFTVIWSNNATTLTISNLAPGAYTVTVTDNKGCTKSNTANVNGINCTINGEVSSTNLNCAGAPTGSATVNVGGAPTPITYLWSNGATTKTASNLAAGNYSVTATAANGCTIVLATQVSSPQPLVLSVVSNTSITCAGLQNGSASVNASGGTAPYSYNWSNGGSNAMASGLAAGAYTCTTTDANGCTASQTAVVGGPQPVTLAVVTKVDVPCIDGQSGSITMNASGGTAPFNYTWSNNASGPSASGLGLGNYICTATDANGCSKTLSAQIVATDNTGPQLILKNASVALNTGGNATVTPAMFDNGSFDAQCSIVNWTISPTSFNCSQLGARTVTLTATDKNSNSTTGTATVTVLDNIAPVLNCPPSQSGAPCTPNLFFNTPDIQDNCTVVGTATLTSGLPSGSVFPVGVTQQQFSYTDAGGNTATCEFTITVLNQSSYTPSAQPASCTGTCDGSATLTGTGNPISVIWNNGQTGLTAVNLCAGNYFATVTDASGCTQTYLAAVQVLDNQAPTLTCPANIVAGHCNPTVNFPQPQVFDNCAVNLQQLQQVSGLPSGSVFPTGLSTQTFRYIDHGGNTGECSFSVSIHLPPSINHNSSNVTCASLCNGQASINVSGGQAPFGILWSNGGAGPAIGNLCPGSYSATITDGDGCLQTQTLQITEPNPLLISAFVVNNDVGNVGSGSILVVVTGGTPPYSFTWSRNGQYFASAQNLFGLFSGQYALVITDANSCMFSSSVFTVSNPVATSEPENNFKWQVFPNPAQSEVFIKMEETTGNSQLSIFDASGKLLLEQDVTPVNGSTVRIDLSGLPDGMLQIRLDNDLGVFSKRLVKN